MYENELYRILLSVLVARKSPARVNFLFIQKLARYFVCYSQRGNYTLASSN